MIVVDGGGGDVLGRRSTIGLGSPAASSGPPPFNPLTLSPAVWYDASDATSITLNGSNVSQWNDKSGNGRHAVQATAGNQPLYTIAGQNGLNVVTFNGTSYRMASTGPAVVSQPDTVFIVFRAVPPTLNRHPIDGNLQRQLITGDTNWRIYAGTVLDSLVPGDGNTVLLTALFNGASSTLRRNGTQIAAGAAGAQGIDTLWLGAAAGGVNLFPGYICEVIVAPSIVGATERDNCEAYLRTKWGTP